MSTIHRCGASLLAAIAIAGCSDASGPGGAHVSVLLTDAPGDVHAAVVTIAEVYLVGPDGPVTLSATPVTVDLTTLANTTADLVTAADVEPGEFSELRFVITGGYVEVENADGSTTIYASSPAYEGLPEGAVASGTLQMPSLAQSGLKVSFDDDAIVVDDVTTLLVDFDVSQSFGHVAGQSGRWVMHPVIRGAVLAEAATVTANLSLAGALTLPSVRGAAITLGAFRGALDGEELLFDDPDGDGVYSATYTHVLPGPHSFTVMAPIGLSITTSPTIPTTLTVAPGAHATVDIVVQGAIEIP
jgi:hypothetical protein